MKNSIYVMLLFLVACGGGGGGGGGPGPGQGTPPQISNLQLQDDFAFVMAGNGTSSVFAQGEFNDPDRDLASIQVEISDGSILVIPLPGPVTEASGILVGDIVFNTILIITAHFTQFYISSKAGLRAILQVKVTYFYPSVSIPFVRFVCDIK